LLDHWDRLPEDLRADVRNGIEHACRSIMRRNVGPGYTNIALMGAYGTLLAESLLRHIEVASEERLSLTSGEPATFRPELLRLRPRLPEDLFSFFTTPTEPRQEIETFLRNDGDFPDIIGTTWLHPDVSLGSVNCGDLWNQRRPLVALALGPVTARLAVPLARFDGRDLRVETWAEGRRRGIDLILYSGCRIRSIGVACSKAFTTTEREWVRKSILA
jgi:hypothetical protein